MQKVNRYISKRYLHQGRVSKINISSSALNVLTKVAQTKQKSIKEEEVVEQPVEKTDEEIVKENMEKLGSPMMVDVAIEEPKKEVEQPTIIETKEDVVEEFDEAPMEEEKVETIPTRKESAYAKRKREKDNNK